MDRVNIQAETPKKLLKAGTGREYSKGQIRNAGPTVGGSQGCQTLDPVRPTHLGNQIATVEPPHGVGKNMDRLIANIGFEEVA
jgi:hypothetical protein